MLLARGQLNLLAGFLALPEGTATVLGRIPGVHGADTALANRRRCGGQLEREQLLTQSHQCRGVSAAACPLSGRLHGGTPLLAAVPIAALPPERARLRLSAARGRGPTEPGTRRGAVGLEAPRQVRKQAQDVSTIAEDGALKSRGTQRGRPGAHQRPRLALAAPQQPPCLIAAGLAPAGQGAGAVGSGKGKGSSGERAGTGPGYSPQAPHHGFLMSSLGPSLFWPWLIVSRAQHTAPLFLTSPHLRAGVWVLFRSALCAVSLVLNLQLPQLGALYFFDSLADSVG